MNLKINEIFYSLQGEGARTGQASIFIRLSNCDLSCEFCDTEFEAGKELTLDELYERIKNIACQWIVWTGGEPALQLTKDIIQYFKDKGYYQAIETNGNNSLPEGLDYIAISPKVAEHVLAMNFPNGVNELRYACHKGKMSIPEPKIQAEHYFLSPIFDSNKINQENLKHCIELCLKNPKWKLSIQLHKLLQIL